MHNILNRSCLLSDAERRNIPQAIIGGRVITRASIERAQALKDNNTNRPMQDDAADVEALQEKVKLLEVENNDLRTIMSELAATANNALRELDKARAKQQRQQQQPQQRKQAQRATGGKKPTAAEVARVIRSSSAALARMQTSRSYGASKPVQSMAAAPVTSRPMAQAYRSPAPRALASAGVPSAFPVRDILTSGAVLAASHVPLTDLLAAGKHMDAGQPQTMAGLPFGAREILLASGCREVYR